MAQPYDYSLNLPSPVQGFLQGVQIGQAFRQQEAQKAQAQQARERAQIFQQRVAQLRDNPSPAAIDSLYFDFPEMKEQLDVFSARIGDADKRTYGDVARRAIVARKMGLGDAEVAKIYEEGKLAAERAGRTDLVKQFEDAAMVAANPQGGDDIAARLLLNRLDPEGYKVIFGDGAQLDKDYELNVRLFGKEQADQMRKAEQLAKGFVTATGPAGTTYQWAPSIIPAAAATSATTPPPSGSAARTFNNVKVLPADLRAGDIVNGQEYLGGPTNVATSWKKAGGQTGGKTPSGNFPGK